MATIEGGTAFMTSEDERTTATLTADESSEQEDGGWFFNLSDDARRREADLTRDLRRALVDEYRQQDKEKTKRKRLFGLLPVGAGESGDGDEAVPAFLPRPQAQREDSSGPVAARPTMRLSGRAGRPRQEPIDEEVMPPEPSWTPRFLRESADASEPLPPQAPLRQPPSEDALDIDLEQETSDWFNDEPAADRAAPLARPAPAVRAPLYAGEDDWTTALVPETMAALSALDGSAIPAAAPVVRDVDEETPIAEAFMRLAADEADERSFPAEDREPFPLRAAQPAASRAMRRAPTVDDWHTEPLAALAGWEAAPLHEAGSPAATGTADASLATWFDETFQEDEEPSAPAPEDRFAPEPQPAPAPARRAARNPATNDDWTSEITPATCSAFLAGAELATSDRGEDEGDDAPLALRRPRPVEAPASESEGTSRWDEMIASSKGATGSIVDAMREVWSETPADDGARKRRALRGIRREARQADDVPEAVAAPEPEATPAQSDERARFVGKLGGMIRRRRHDDHAEEDAAPAADVPADLPAAEAEAEIPATLWKELFGDPGQPGASPEPVAFEPATELRQGVHTFADPVPVDDLPVDEDISLAEIFGEAAAPGDGTDAAEESDVLLPPAPVWVDDDPVEADPQEERAPVAVFPSIDERVSEARAAAMPAIEAVEAHGAQGPETTEDWTSEPFSAFGSADSYSDAWDWDGFAEPASQAGATGDGVPPVALDAEPPALAADTPAEPWGDLSGGALPGGIAWPETTEAADQTVVEETDLAGLFGDTFETGAVADAPRAEHTPEIGPVADEPETTLVSLTGPEEPSEERVRPAASLGAFKPIQEALHDGAGDDDWAVFFGVEETGPNDGEHDGGAL